MLSDVIPTITFICESACAGDFARRAAIPADLLKFRPDDPSLLPRRHLEAITQRLPRLQNALVPAQRPSDGAVSRQGHHRQSVGHPPRAIGFDDAHLDRLRLPGRIRVHVVVRGHLDVDKPQSTPRIRFVEKTSCTRSASPPPTVPCCDPRSVFTMLNSYALTKHLVWLGAT